MNIDELYQIIKDRQEKLPPDSYVAGLYKAGKNKMIAKVVEESKEVVLAVRKETKKRVVSELADLWFHLLVLMAALDISPEDVFTELEKRRK